MIDLREGDCLAVMASLAANSLDSAVTDPPYHLTSIVKRFGAANAAPAKSNGATGVYGRASAGFMGQTWDGGDVAFRPETWAEVLRVLKPGGYLLAFGGTRTYHRLACAVEDAGFEIRDQIGWAYGSGFPKSLDVSKAIDKAAGAEREVVGIHPRPAGNKAGGNSLNMSVLGMPASATVTTPATPEAVAWQGWGTALKPAWEPIVVARKPLIGTVAANVLAHGTGALNIDGCRVATGDKLGGGAETGTRPEQKGNEGWTRPWMEDEAARDAHAGRVRDNVVKAEALGRWPANLVHDGSDEVLAAFPDAKGQIATASSSSSSSSSSRKDQNVYGAMARGSGGNEPRDDTGSAARFFYCAKASKSERGEGNSHPTVKPLALMRWLVRLVTPPGGTVLDPFAGSGTTGLAAREEGFRSLLIEAEPKHAGIIRNRLGLEVDIFA
jgi:site-specific DNA-methyltransferase (adenine-specific)